MLLPTDGELAQIQLAAYAYNGVPYAFDWYGEPAGVAVGIKLVADTAVICFIGSKTMQDWLRDFTVVPTSTIKHPKLGPIHRGFATGLDEVMAAIVPILTDIKAQHIVVIGHSLGAARAPIYAGALMDAGLVPSRIVMFAPPRPGYAALGAYLYAIPKVLFRTVGKMGWLPSHDYVTDVPATMTFFPFVEVGPFCDLPVTPKDPDLWGIFKFHHMELYAGALVGR